MYTTRAGGSVVAVAAGANATCYLRANGTVACGGWWPFPVSAFAGLTADPTGNQLVGLAAGPAAATLCGISRRGSTVRRTPIRLQCDGIALAWCIAAGGGHFVIIVDGPEPNRHQNSKPHRIRLDARNAQRCT